VTSVAVGQRAIIPFQISCGACSRCRRGRTASCEEVQAGAMYGLEPFGGPWGGFLSDVVRVPWADHMLVPLPEGIDPIAVASLSDNIPDGWRTVAPWLEQPASASVLVVAGAAPSIPFYSIAIARALGVPRVDYLEVDGVVPPQADKAVRAGATVLRSAEDVETQGYQVTVCSASDPAHLALALRATEPDGTCVVNAIFFGDDAVPTPMFSMYTRGVRLVTGRVNARAVMPEALALVSHGAFDPALVTDAVVEWSDAAEALTASPQKLVIHRCERPSRTVT
jgi:threonine dehydrogenase-like Zn-dependent dehydrogenase